MKNKFCFFSSSSSQKRQYMRIRQ